MRTSAILKHGNYFYISMIATLAFCEYTLIESFFKI